MNEERDNLNASFLNACEMGDMDSVLKSISFDDLETYEIGFGLACGSGNIELVELLLKLEPNLNLNTHHDFPFRMACKCGSLEIAKLLMERSKHPININVYNDEPFRKSCRYGHFHLVLWLLEIGKIKVHAKDGYAFRKSCRYGHYKIARFLIKIDDKLTHDDYNESFQEACINGHLIIARWIYNICYYSQYPIVISNIGSDLFLDVCENGKLDVAKWLFDLDDNLKFRRNMDYVFRIACTHNYIEMVLWLKTLYFGYYFKIENDKIVNFGIR